MPDDSHQRVAPTPEPEHPVVTKTGLLVTNLIKLGGVAVVLNEVFIERTIRTEAIAVAALMMAGAQSLETFLTSFFGGKGK